MPAFHRRGGDAASTRGGLQRRGGLGFGGPREQHRAAPAGEQLGHDPGALLRRLPRPVDGLGEPLAQ